MGRASWAGRRADDGAQSPERTEAKSVRCCRGDLCERRHAPYIRDRRASQGLLGRVAPSGGARQGPIAGYVLQSAAPAGPSP
eukprot:scaffold38257_cov63-Phaeocystis_antarctica.AAC.3